LDQNPSQIYGNLSANGQVFLVNSQGIYFGPTARVDVGGLVASSLNITNENFLAGKYLFEKDGSGSIINKGTINAGYAAFLSPSITNEGVITARTVAMAAGDKVSLDFTGDNLINFSVDKGAVDALIENKGLIQADGGLVMMTAKAADTLTSAVVNNSGIIEARTIENRSGRILLLADMESGETIVGGRLDASALNGGDGGFIETSAKKVTVKDDAQVTTLAPDGKTGRWLIDPHDFTIAASGGDMTGTALTTALSGGNVEIQSGSGASGTNGDIFVNDSVTWSANTLTLNAYRNIKVNSALYGSGTAGLSLLYGQGAAASGNTAAYSINAPVNLASTGSFSTQLGSDGTTNNYTIITSLGTGTSSGDGTLQGMQGSLSGYYVLGANIDASGTNTWNGGMGFAPVGNTTVEFTGTLDGLGHTISGLTINRSSNYVGLFGYTGSAASIANVGLVSASITGSSTVAGLLAGRNDGVIANSYATGSVTGFTRTGGLVGYNEGRLLHTYSTATVNGSAQTGGLVGYNGVDGQVTESYASGTVNGTTYVGGLVGHNIGVIANSYATGSVTGNDAVGGLVGYNVHDPIGGYYGAIRQGYATGAVNGSSNTGGLTGKNEAIVSRSFWDADTTGQGTVGCGDDMTCGGGAEAIYSTSGTSAFAYATYAGASWVITNTGSSSSIWRIYEGHGYPLLISFLTPLAISISDVTRTYDGTTDASSAVRYSLSPVDSSLLLGTLTAATSSKNAGSYTVTPSGYYSGQQGYNINYVSGTITITPATLTLNAVTDTKTYDGTTTSGGTVSYSGLQAGDTLSGLAQSFADKNVLGAGNSTLNVTGYTVSDGNSGGNYTVVTNSANGTINKALLTISTSDVTRTYDGTTSASGTATVTSGTLYGTDSISGGTFAFADKNVGTNKTVSVSGVTVSDGNSGGNYSVSYAGNATSTITRKPLTAVYTASNKLYDGTTDATVTGSSADIVSGDAIAFSQDAAFVDQNIGSNKTVNIWNIAIGGAMAGNYSLQNVTATATANIIDPTVRPVRTSNTAFFPESVNSAQTSFQNSTNSTYQKQGDDTHAGLLGAGTGSGTLTALGHTTLIVQEDTTGKEQTATP
jgi:hypothetical protein